MHLVHTPRCFVFRWLLLSYMQVVDIFCLGHFRIDCSTVNMSSSISFVTLVWDLSFLKPWRQVWGVSFSTLSTTKTASAVFHLNNKEAKCELKVNFNNETLPFCSEPKNLRVMLYRLLTYCWHLESLRKKLTSRSTLLRQLTGSGCGSGATMLRTATLAMVHSTAEYCALFGAAVLIPTSLTPWELGLDACILHQWTNFQSSQASNLLSFIAMESHVSRTPCHGAWTSAPLGAYPSIECRCTAPQIETLHQCQAFLLLLVQMGYGLLCNLWVWHRRINHRPCCPPMSNGPPHGLHSLTVLDDETTEWLLNTCPKIWRG